MPFGRYVEDKVLNVGSNRWNVVDQLGVSRQPNRRTIESAIGISWYSHNGELLGTRKLEQDPIGLFRATLSPLIFGSARELFMPTAGIRHSMGSSEMIGKLEQTFALIASPTLTHSKLSRQQIIVCR